MTDEHLQGLPTITKLTLYKVIPVLISKDINITPNPQKEVMVARNTITWSDTLKTIREQCKKKKINKLTEGT